MDMREIEQLHAQYAQSTLTIDISPSSSPSPRAASPLRLGNAVHGADGGAEAAAVPGRWVPPPRALWAVVFVVGATAMFLIGSTMGKREVRSQNTAAPAPAAAVSSAASAGQALPAAEPLEWPQRNEASEAIQQASAVVAAPASNAEAPKIVLPKQEAAKPSPSPTKSVPAIATPVVPTTAPAKVAAPTPPRPAVPQQAAPNRDIKLF